MKLRETAAALAFVTLLIGAWGYLGPRFDPPRWKPTQDVNRTVPVPAEDPRNLLLGRYRFETPEGTHGGSNGSGGARFLIVVGSGPVHWFGRGDLDYFADGAMNLHTFIRPLSEHVASNPRKPPNDSAVTTRENVMAFFDVLIHLRPMWLKDARGDHPELVCSAGEDRFRELVERRSISVLTFDTCELGFYPRSDIRVRILFHYGSDMALFLANLNEVYALVSDSIKDPR